MLLTVCLLGDHSGSYCHRYTTSQASALVSPLPADQFCASSGRWESYIMPVAGMLRTDYTVRPGATPLLRERPIPALSLFEIAESSGIALRLCQRLPMMEQHCMAAVYHQYWVSLSIKLDKLAVQIIHHQLSRMLEQSCRISSSCMSTAALSHYSRLCCPGVGFLQSACEFVLQAVYLARPPNNTVHNIQILGLEDQVPCLH